MFYKNARYFSDAFNTASESISSVTLALLTAFTASAFVYPSATSASTASFAALPESPFPAAGETAALPSNSGVSRSSACTFILQIENDPLCRLCPNAWCTGDRLRIPSHNRKTQILRTQRRQDAKCPFGYNAVDPRSWRNISRSERLKSRYRLISSSRTCRCVYIFTSSPSGGKTSSTDIGTKSRSPSCRTRPRYGPLPSPPGCLFTYEITVNSFLFSLVQDLVQTKKNASKCLQIFFSVYHSTVFICKESAEFRTYILPS